MKIGFIGLGNLGMAISKTLLREGFDLSVHNRSRGKVEAMVALGAKSAFSAAEITRSTDIVITCLPDVPTVEEVYLGPDGIIANAKAGQILIDQSTVSPSTSRKLAQVADSKGVKWMDAPVSGTADLAEAGRLTVLVGGDREAFEQAKPIFQAEGGTVLYLGPPGSGTIVKLAVNALLATNVTGIAEAFNFGVKMGVDPQLLIEAFKSGSARSFALEITGDPMVNRDFGGSASLRLFHKDLGLYRESASDNGVVAPSAEIARQLYGEVLNNWPDANHLASVLMALESSGHQYPDSN